MTIDKTAVRVLLVTALLAATGLYLQARQGKEVVPRAPEAASFPNQVGSWTGQDEPIAPNILKALGPGDFLSRTYTTPAAGVPYVDFFIGYFPSQSTGDTIHSPKNCLPGSGWTPMETGYLQIPIAGRPPLQVNRYIIAQSSSRDLVLYWYQAHGRTTPSEYWARLYLVADAIHMNRTDGALVRIITPIAQSESISSAQRRAVGFAQQVVPAIDNYIPN